MSKVYFEQSEAIESIIEVLENGYDGYLCDLHSEVFNTDYYIIGTYEAKQALEQYGVFDAIEEIKTYELDNFGKVYTDFSNPEKVANMLWYVIGDAIINDLACEFSDLWDNCVDDEDINNIINYIKENL